jgi:hypothetical protein
MAELLHHGAGRIPTKFVRKAGMSTKSVRETGTSTKLVRKRSEREEIIGNDRQR